MLVDPESSPALRDLSAASREELTLKEIKNTSIRRRMEVFPCPKKTIVILSRP